MSHESLIGNSQISTFLCNVDVTADSLPSLPSSLEDLFAVLILISLHCVWGMEGEEEEAF